MEKSIEMERAMGIDLFARLRVSAAERKQFFDALAAFGTSAPPPPATQTGLKDMPVFIMGLIEEGINSAGPAGREHLWCWFWSYEDERRCLQADQATLDRLRQAANRGAFDPMPATSDEASFGFALDPERARKQRYLVSASRGDSLEHCLLKVARIETRRTLVVTAIALKRYELRREKPAPDLNALVPGILARLPVDWMDGRPLRYRLKADGHFLLYSVNEDGRDDGGDPTSPEGKSAWDNGRDLVWPTPATGSEIAQAQEKEANANPRPRSGRVAAP